MSNRWSRVSSTSESLTEENTNALAHRIAGDSPVYECPNCEFGEVLVTEPIESDDARCLDYGTRYRFNIETVAQERVTGRLGGGSVGSLARTSVVPLGPTRSVDPFRR